MIKMFSKRTKNQKGFTLVELIVVIAIIGILAAVAVPRLTGVQETARINAHEQNRKVLRSAATIYIAENGNPESEMNAAATELALKGRYIEEWPTSPWTKSESHADKDNKYEVTISQDGEIKVSFE